MYIEDKNHPTQAASYLSAACLYAAMFKESPKGIEYYGTVKDVASNSIINLNFARSDTKNSEKNSPARARLEKLDSKLVKKLQSIAAETMGYKK